MESNKLVTRTEELKRLVWDKKLSDEVKELCEMVNPDCSASLVQDISIALEKRIKWMVELKLFDSSLEVVPYSIGEDL